MTILAFIGVACLVAASWNFANAWRYRGWSEVAARVIRFDAAGWTATVEAEDGGALRSVVWPTTRRSTPATGTRLHLVHPPVDPARLVLSGGSPRSLRRGAALLLVAFVLLALDRGLA
ncbi:hypothetical protein [Neoroseomonas rubea]|uniref:hypothetical protein n=1 Tax=Neoroseomonas rubea TaxID=2748666 RepID=UPI0018DF27E3|nr:hypothetical protein [Roseomonas rubea]